MLGRMPLLVALLVGGTAVAYQEFVSSQKRRFALLEISGPTRAELLAALDFTWKALHDPEVPSEKREAAEKIRELMTTMGGRRPAATTASSNER